MLLSPPAAQRPLLTVMSELRGQGRGKVRPRVIGCEGGGVGGHLVRCLDRVSGFLSWGAVGLFA